MVVSALARDGNVIPRRHGLLRFEDDRVVGKALGLRRAWLAHRCGHSTAKVLPTQARPEFRTFYQLMCRSDQPDGAIRQNIDCTESVFSPWRGRPGKGASKADSRSLKKAAPFALDPKAPAAARRTAPAPPKV